MAPSRSLAARAAALAAAVALLPSGARACSNLLASRGAMIDGAATVGYLADDIGLFGSLDFRPGGIHAPGTMRPIWDWDDQEYTGEIPEVNQTYTVVGNVNENGVMITETTFGGRADLDGGGTGAIMSYGDLIWTTLSRARTAREAIYIMDELCTAYGYESSGESFGVADDTEVWLLELIGKGKYGKGAVWVASRVPEGYVTATANQARTETFNQTDPDNVLFAKDVITFARSIGAYNGTDADFNFREAYDPITFGGCRFAEARVWNMLNTVCAGCLDAHLDYAQGYNTSNSMPLFVPAAQKLDFAAFAQTMRTHFELTWFDNTGDARPDVGAGQGHSPYRFRPLTWSYNGSTYLNERTVGIQQSGWAFIAQSRSWLPGPIKAVEWFAPDDSSTSPRIPAYGGATRIPGSFGDRVGQTPGGGVDYAPVTDAFMMNLNSAFWIWNLVGNIAFSERYRETQPIVLDKVDAVQADLLASAAAMEKEFLALYGSDPGAAVEYMTSFMEGTGEQLMQEWTQFWMFLFATFRDGDVLSPSTGQACAPGQTTNCTAKLLPNVNETGYTEDWRGRIVSDSDNAKRYLVPADARSEESHAPSTPFSRATLEEVKEAVASGKRKGRAAIRAAREKLRA